MYFIICINGHFIALIISYQAFKNLLFFDMIIIFFYYLRPHGIHNLLLGRFE